MEEKKKMKIRLIIEPIIVTIITLFLFISDVYKYLLTFFGVCDSVTNEVCISKGAFWLLLFWVIFCIGIIFLIEWRFWIIRKNKARNAFVVENYIDNPYECSVSVINKSYSIIENCSVELIRANVLNKKGCKNVFDKNTDMDKIPRMFVWDDGSESRNLVKGAGIIKISRATKGERLILSTKKFLECQYIFPDRRHGKLNRRTTYQIEIKVTGKAAYDGIEQDVEDVSFWEINYRYAGHYNAQSVWIKRLKELQAINKLGLGEFLPQSHSFNIVLENFKSNPEP
jgi:hypothetical protein